MELKPIKIFGILKILGGQVGEFKVTSKCKEMLTCVQLDNAVHIL
jgi:hypothetical protein